MGEKRMQYIIIWLAVIVFSVVFQTVRQNKNAQTGGRQNPGQQWQRPGQPGRTQQYGAPGRYGAPGQGGSQPRYGNPGMPAPRYGNPGMPAPGYGNRAGAPGQGGSQPRYGNPGRAGGGTGQRAQQELKNRLQQRYGSPAGRPGGAPSGGRPGGNQPRGAYQGRPVGNQPRGGQQKAAPSGGWQAQGDILSRAAANVRENEKDELELLMNASGGLTGNLYDCESLPGVTDLRESSELMREVADLMIMGYQVQPVSTRDFVAEGVEMLGQYE